MGIKLFTLDFHGTLEQGTEHAVREVSNLVLADFGYDERFTPEDVDHCYGMKWCQYFAYLLCFIVGLLSFFRWTAE